MRSRVWTICSARRETGRKNRAETGKGGTGFASTTGIEIGFVWRGHDAFEVEITDYH